MEINTPCDLCAAAYQIKQSSSPQFSVFCFVVYSSAASSEGGWTRTVVGGVPEDQKVKHKLYISLAKQCSSEVKVQKLIREAKSFYILLPETNC